MPEQISFAQPKILVFHTLYKKAQLCIGIL